MLNTRYAGAANSQATRTAMAAVGGDLPRRVDGREQAAPATTAIDNAAYLSSFPGSAQRDAGGRDVADRLGASEPIFRSLFQAGERTQPISPAVQELWGNDSSLTRLRQRPRCVLSDKRPKSARRAGSISSATATARSAAECHARRTLMVRSREAPSRTM